MSGATVWITGLSGAGKSSLAGEVLHRLVEDGRGAQVLDADNLRLWLNRDLGYSDEDRAENTRRIGEVAILAAEAGLVAIVPVISPSRADRRVVRERHTANDVLFIEVHMATDLETCEARDPKGLYARARRGELSKMTGIDSAYEEPLQPEVRVETGTSLDEAGRAVLRALYEQERKSRADVGQQ